MNNARFLQDCRIPAGNWDGDAVAEKLNQTLAQEYPNVGNLVKTVMNYQVFSTVTSSRKTSWISPRSSRAWWTC